MPGGKWPAKPGSSHDLVISGVFQIPYKGKHEKVHMDSDESDGDDAEDEIDMSLELFGGDLSESDVVVKSRLPKDSKVDITDDNGKSYTCQGRFPLTQVYWKVTAKLANRCYLRGAASYAIRTDDDNVQRLKLVMIFLSDCFGQKLKADEENSAKACFEAYYRSLNEAEQPPTFTNLEKTLKRYLIEEKLKGCCLSRLPHGSYGHLQQKDHSSDFRAFVLGSELGTVVLLAASHPQLVKTVSELLPNHFIQLLYRLKPRDQSSQQTNDPEDDDDENSEMTVEVEEDYVTSRPPMNFLENAAVMAKMSPWEFAFRDVVSRKLNVYGVESTLSAYEHAGYMSRTPQTEKDAIYIYEVLKRDSKSDGHTYMGFRRLQNSHLFGRLNYKINSEQRWKSALDYLENNRVIVRETFNCEENIFLRSYWQAEVDTAEGLNKIMRRQQMEPFKWDIDFESPDFESLRSDPDQQRAMHLIASLPITVISGKGGCGKTTVVTKMLKHLCDKKEEEVSEQRERERKERQEREQQGGKGKQLAGDNTDMDTTRQSQPPASTSLSSSQTLQAERKKWTVPDVDSKEGKFRKLVVEDLVKIVEQSKLIDDVTLADFKKTMLLTAPTGKAARLLGCKSDLPSATLHSVIMSWRNHARSLFDPAVIAKKVWTYESVKTLVVDECSLVSIRLFASVLNILLVNADLRKIILLGDIRQLPSIDAGDFLRDMFRTLGRVGDGSFSLSIELTRNHRSESQLIVQNAANISTQRMPTFDDEQRFHLVNLSETSDDNERDEAIRNLLTHAEDVKCDVSSQFVTFRNAHCRAINELCCKHYNNHATKCRSQSGRREHLDFEIGDKICLKKNSLVANYRMLMLDRYLSDSKELQEAINKVKERQDNILNDNSKDDKEVVCPTSHVVNQSKSVLNPERAIDLLGSDDVEFDETVAEMMERDQQMEMMKTEREKRERLKQAGKQKAEFKAKSSLRVTPLSLLGAEKEKLCNGEVFFIMDIIETDQDDQGATQNKKSQQYFILSDREPHVPRVVCVPLRVLKRECDIKHSWARTIHTYQGSESNTVVYVLGKAIPQNWQHVYTAITRGRKSVYVVGSWAELHKAVTRREHPRHSRLLYRLEKMLMDNSECIKIFHMAFLTSFDPAAASTLDISTDVDDGFLDSDDSWMLKVDASAGKMLDTADVSKEDLGKRGEGSTCTIAGQASGTIPLTTNNNDEEDISRFFNDTESFDNEENFINDLDQEFQPDDRDHLPDSSDSDSYNIVDVGSDDNNEDEDESIFVNVCHFRKKDTQGASAGFTALKNPSTSSSFLTSLQAKSLMLKTADEKTVTDSALERNQDAANTNMSHRRGEPAQKYVVPEKSIANNLVTSSPPKLSLKSKNVSAELSAARGDRSCEATPKKIRFAENVDTTTNLVDTPFREHFSDSLSLDFDACEKRDDERDEERDDDWDGKRDDDWDGKRDDDWDGKRKPVRRKL